MKEISSVIGYVVETDILIPLFHGHIEKELQKTAFKTVENILVRVNFLFSLFFRWSL